MDWKKWVLSGAKYFIVALVGVVIAALTVAKSGYVPGNPLEQVLWQYVVLPAIIGIVGLLQNYVKHKD